MNDWPLLGVAVVVVGLALKRNPVLVVVLAGVVSAFAAGKSPGEILALFGNAFVKNRTLLLFTATLPVIGVLERAGLRERARTWILGFARLTLSRLLIAYLLVRQGLSMLGLTQIAGHPQTVRPLLAPMAEATAKRQLGELGDASRERVRALCAATDNIGLFFGEDVFLAFGGVLLIQSFFHGQGIELDPLSIGLWALPTAVAALVIHAVRIAIFQRRLAAQVAAARQTAPTTPGAPGSPGGEAS